MDYEELVKYANDFIKANDTPEIYTISNEGLVQNMSDPPDRFIQGHLPSYVKTLSQIRSDKFSWNRYTRNVLSGIWFVFVRIKSCNTAA